MNRHRRDGAVFSARMMPVCPVIGDTCRTNIKKKGNPCDKRIFLLLPKPKAGFPNSLPTFGRAEFARETSFRLGHYILQRTAV